MGSQSQDATPPQPIATDGEKQESKEDSAAPEGESITTQMVEEPKNGSIVLNQTDLEVIARVQSRLKEIEADAAAK
jgi:hypothetical protein